MVYSTNIIKKNNHLSAQIFEHKEKTTTMKIWRWKSRCLRHAQKCGDVTPVNWIPTIPILIIGFPTEKKKQSHYYEISFKGLSIW